MKTRRVYKAKMFNVEEVSFRIRGKRYKFDRVVGSNITTVLPVMKDGKIILERQYRHVLGRYLYELPAGHIEKGEKPMDGALRELEEEIGYRAKTIKRVFGAYPTPGLGPEYSTFFVATNLVKTKTKMDVEEIISIKIVTLEKALEMIRKNEIVDLKTIALILFYKNFYLKD